jgi:two-component system response regulator FixJ
MASEEQLIHVVDDDEGVRRSLDFMLSHAGHKVQRWDSADAFLRGADRMVPACALIDIRMPGMDGLALQKAMKAEGFDFPVIILSGHGDIAMAVQAMQAGAIDFLQKPADRQHVLEAVAQAFAVLEDTEKRGDRADLAQAQLGRLTMREREVLDGLACGYPNKTIAYDLGISARTVEVYRANIMDKLRVSSFADALRVAFAAGLGCEEKWLEAHTLIGRPAPSMG